MERLLGREFAELYNGDDAERREFFREYCEFFHIFGYDTVSFEDCIGPSMPGSGSLGSHKPGEIRDRADFDRYPWKQIPDLFFERYDDDFRLLSETMPAGMKAVGGPGNGVFELVQDVVGFQDLCYIKADDPELYADLFAAVGTMMYAIWKRFLKQYADTYAVLRFGDDLGFKSATLLLPEDIRSFILPQYRRIVACVHASGKPFLLHSCGCIFSIMDDLIAAVGINAKHSNEDQIAPFSEWVDRYGGRIALFGGVDTDHLCRKSSLEIAEIVRDVAGYAVPRCGFALGSGNSIPDYVPVEGFLAMNEAGRRFRGE
jgi:uroporphyrinogen decarboxylase